MKQIIFPGHGKLAEQTKALCFVKKRCFTVGDLSCGLFRVMERDHPVFS